MNKLNVPRDISVPKVWDRTGLPSWSYHNSELLEIEKSRKQGKEELFIEKGFFTIAQYFF